MNVSEYILNFFVGKGVDTVFMVTGGQAMWLNDAVAKHDELKFICHHHEQAAAMSADAYGRLKNKPALCMVTAGPGSVNALNGVVGGWTDSSPMIVISGQSALSFVRYQQRTGIRQHGIQGINIKPLVENITKFFVTIDNPQKLNFYLEKAWQLCTTGRPGPVWLDVPLDIQRMSVDELNQQQFVGEPLSTRRASLKHAVDNVFDRLKHAVRPIILAGQGIALAAARSEFRALIDKVRIPIITSRLGIDLIESDNELYVGRPGNYGERAANIALQNADVIVSIGSRLASATVGYSPETFGRNAYKFVVDIDPKELDKPGVKIDFKIESDCGEFLRAMLKKSSEIPLPNYDEWIGLCNDWKRAYPVVQPEYAAEQPVNSYYFIDRLSRIAASNAVILVDTGSCFHVACQTWKIKAGQKFLTTGGLSSMGYWCAGIGACVANDCKETIVITGDGSLQMNLQEFATIVGNKLPIKTFILDNNGYLLIRNTQRNFMQDRFIGESPKTGVWCPNSLKIADAYGIKSFEIASAAEVDEKIRRVLELDAPVVCNVRTPEWQRLQPRISSEKLADGTLVSHDYEDMFPFLPREELRQNMVADRDRAKV